MHRRRRTDKLPTRAKLPEDAYERAQKMCNSVAAAGFASALVLHLPLHGGQGVVFSSSGRTEAMLDIARGLAKQVIANGAPLHTLSARGEGSLFSSQKQRYAAMPLARTSSGTLVLIVSDPRLSRRECKAMAVWAAPERPNRLQVNGGSCGDLIHQIAIEYNSDTVVVALFAQAGMLLQLYTRSGALLHTWRVPTDTIWGEVARHGVAFTLGDLSLHAGGELLGAMGMSQAALAGLENGAGIAIGAIGVASTDELPLDISERLLHKAQAYGPQIMRALSATDVPVLDDNGTVDLATLSRRIGCQRFAVYQRDQEVTNGEVTYHLSAALTSDGTRIVSPPDPDEAFVITRAATEARGVELATCAAIPIGSETILYAQDPSGRALERLRRALQDVQKNPYGASGNSRSIGDSSADAA